MIENSDFISPDRPMGSPDLVARIDYTVRYTNTPSNANTLSEGLSFSLTGSREPTTIGFFPAPLMGSSNTSDVAIGSVSGFGIMRLGSSIEVAVNQTVGTGGVFEGELEYTITVLDDGT